MPAITALSDSDASNFIGTTPPFDKKLDTFLRGLEANSSHVLLFKLCIALSIIFGVVIIPVNFVIFKYFSKKNLNNQNEVIRFMFRSLSGTDSVVGVVALLQGVVRLQIWYRIGSWDYWNDSVEVSMVINYFISHIALRMSVFLNVVMAVIRTYHIISPFRSRTVISLRVIKIAITIYLLINVVFFIIDMYYIYEVHFECEREQKFYQEYEISLVSTMLYILPFGSGISRIITFAQLGKSCTKLRNDPSGVYHSIAFISLGYALPAVLVLITLFIQLKGLFSNPNSKESESGQRNDMSKKKTAGTILYLSLSFFLCNVAFLAHVIHLYYFQLERDESGKHKPYESTKEHPLFYSEKIAAYISSLLNPIILISRSKSLKEYVKRVITTRSWNSGRKETQPRTEMFRLSSLQSNTSTLNSRGSGVVSDGTPLHRFHSTPDVVTKDTIVLNPNTNHDKMT